VAKQAKPKPGQPPKNGFKTPGKQFATKTVAKQERLRVKK